MNVAIALESRFLRTPDGAVWSPGWVDGSFWERYLQVFDRVRVIARVGEVSAPPASAQRADADRVTFARLPYYVGPWQFAARYRTLRKSIVAALAPADALLLRVPGAIGSIVARTAMREGRPFGLEVVGDPDEVFARGVRSWLAPVLRHTETRALRAQCAHACAVSFVARHPLVRLYPPHSDAFVTTYSSIDLRDDAFARSRSAYERAPAPAKLISVGSMAQLYKGMDLLIKAVAKASGSSRLEFVPHLTLVGDGKHRPDLQALVRAEGLGDRVRFTGTLPPGDAVRTELDKADIFVLASRTEGLPRALIEAMARGLPCLGTNVGAIPELLDAAELVPADDVTRLGHAIVDLAMDPGRLARLSEANLERARRYHADELGPRRVALYRALYEHTRAWLER